MGIALISLVVFLVSMATGVSLVCTKSKVKTIFGCIVLTIGIISFILASLSPGILKTHATQKKLAEEFPGADLEIKQEDENLYVTDGEHTWHIVENEFTNFWGTDCRIVLEQVDEERIVIE